MHRLKTAQHVDILLNPPYIVVMNAFITIPQWVNVFLLAVTYVKKTPIVEHTLYLSVQPV
jgi:hypothetical protein